MITITIDSIPETQQIDIHLPGLLQGKYLALTTGTAIYTFTVKSAWYKQRNLVVEPDETGVKYVSMLTDGWQKMLQKGWHQM